MHTNSNLEIELKLHVPATSVAGVEKAFARGVELLGFQSSVSHPGVELWPFSVRALLLEPNQANFFVTRLVTRCQNIRLTT
jgi:hypothetical protein